MGNLYLVSTILFAFLTWMSWRIRSKHKARKNPPGSIAFGIQAVVFGAVTVFTACKYFF